MRMRKPNKTKVIESLDRFIPTMNTRLYKVGALRPPVRAVVRNQNYYVTPINSTMRKSNRDTITDRVNDRVPFLSTHLLDLVILGQSVKATTQRTIGRLYDKETLSL